MSKSTLTEIDRLEGIALAYRRARPIVPVRGVLEDIGEARRAVEIVSRLEANHEECAERVTELRADLHDARTDRIIARTTCVNAQADLDNLMASLSARLER